VGLARESCRNDVNQSSILGAVEGTYIGEDGSIIEEPIEYPLLDNRLAVGVNFDIAHRPYIKSCKS